eukprot:7687043-Pyramimonas_sp.AAC.1
MEEEEYHEVLKIQDSILSDVRAMRQEFANTSIALKEYEDHMRKKLIDDLSVRLAQVEFRDTAYCVVHKAYCPISPRAVPELAD